MERYARPSCLASARSSVAMVGERIAPVDFSTDSRSSAPKLWNSWEPESSSRSGPWRSRSCCLDVRAFSSMTAPGGVPCPSDLLVHLSQVLVRHGPHRRRSAPAPHRSTRRRKSIWPESGGGAGVAWSRVHESASAPVHRRIRRRMAPGRALGSVGFRPTYRSTMAR